MGELRKPKRFELLLDLDGITPTVGRAAEPKVDFETGAQQFDKDTGEQLCLVQLVLMGAFGAQVISVKVAGEPPKLTPGQQVTVTGLQVIPWAKGDQVRLAFRAESIAPVVSSSSKAA